MGERELREKYGGKLAKAINRAIRAEVTGGDDALNRLTNLAAEAKGSRWKDRTGKETPEATAYFKHQRDVVGKMDAEVRKRWGVPADAGKDDKKPKARKAGPRKTGPPKTPGAGKSGPRGGAGPRSAGPRSSGPRESGPSADGPRSSAPRPKGPRRSGGDRGPAGGGAGGRGRGGPR